jgi:hypothetical protein
MSYDPETSLILQCLSAKEGDKTLHLLHTISSQEINWSYVLLFSRQNGIAPLLFHNMKKYGVAGSIPEEIRLTFAKIYHSVGFQNVLYIEELRNLLHIFEKAGIKTVVLKGAAIVEDVFRNIALRQMADIDLLVQEKDIAMAEEKLSESGYIPDEYQQSKEFYRMNHHHLAPYYHPERKIAVEIHRHIIPLENPFVIDIDKLWKRAQAIKIGAVRTLTLSPEDFIIHACLHLAYCGGFIGGLRSLMDIAQVTMHHRDRIDWIWLTRAACEHNCVNFIYYPLYLAKKLLDAHIKDSIIDNLKWHSKLNWIDISLLNLMTRNILWKDEGSSILPKGYLATVCKQLLHDAPLHKKTQSLIRQLFQKPAFDMKDPHGPESGDYYSFHLKHVCNVFCKIIFHMGKNVLHKRKVRRNIL